MVDVLLGLQWGDEGKGKIVDVFTEQYDVIARFQGGPNAGHTLEFDGIKHVLHTIPSGIFHADKVNLIGNGVILDPFVFARELRGLDPHGVDYHRNLYISRRAHLILPTHRLMDACLEQLKGDAKIGSTLKGIGPTYTDKVGRVGLRVGDIELPGFRNRYNQLMAWHLRLMEGLGYKAGEQLIEGVTLEEYEARWFDAIELIRGLNLVDSELMINDLIRSGKKVLAEGAQGTLLDVDFGSYPFVTSSNTITASACTGLGIAPGLIGEVYGVFKAYCTRVGSGPFPTELFDETGERLRKEGHEFGSTTGRPRRCGWIDLPALRYATTINGVTRLIMTKADVLNTFENIGICNAYEVEGETLDQWTYRCETGKVMPKLQFVKGWMSDITKLTQANEIPEELQNFIKLLETELGIPMHYLSTGPDRCQMIELGKEN
jgi:adenylosuccinate synthase